MIPSANTGSSGLSQSQLMGHTLNKIGRAGVGDVVGLGRLEDVHTGNVLTESGVAVDSLPWFDPIPPVYSMAIAAEKRRRRGQAVDRHRPDNRRRSVGIGGT